MPAIIPAILTDKFEEFEAQVKKIKGDFPYFQLDIMDGEFVSGRSFPQIAKIPDVTDMQMELHLMVNDPLTEMKKWRSNDSVFRVVFHFEAKTDTLRSISYAKKEGWEIGLAINPDTTIPEVENYLDKIDVLQFMTVYPGRHGAPFQEKVLEKIREYTQKENRPKVSVDGGINSETIVKFKDLKIDFFNVGGAVVNSEDPKAAADELIKLL